jgi:hypothetical protein
MISKKPFLNEAIEIDGSIDPEFRNDTEQSYENDEFEKISQSVSMSVDNTQGKKCFLCHKILNKDEAATHSKVCTGLK